jgi:integrase
MLAAMASIETRVTDKGEKRYDVRYRVDGKQHWRTFKRLKDAESHKRKVESEESAGLLIDPRGGETLFGPYAERWLETRLVRGRPLTPATKQGYRGLLRRHILEPFGQTPLRKITPERVREWHSALVASAGADQAAKSYRVLRAVLNTAATDRLIGRNPCTVRGGGVERAPERPLVDTATVLDLADAIDPRLRAFVLLAGFGGLRSGELLGLQRQDIDLMRGLVYVRREAQEIAHVRDESGNVVQRHGRIITEPKTDAGKRSVALPGSIVGEIEQHLEEYVAPDADAVVFTRPTGRYLRRRDLADAWKVATERLGIDGLHPHDLRHHAATMTARIPGVTTRELMARLGHASSRAALIYQHAVEERDRHIADHLDAVIASTERRTAQVVALPHTSR